MYKKSENGRTAGVWLKLAGSNPARIKGHPVVRVSRRNRFHFGRVGAVSINLDRGSEYYIGAAYLPNASKSELVPYIPSA